MDKNCGEITPSVSHRQRVVAWTRPPFSPLVIDRGYGQERQVVSPSVIDSGCGQERQVVSPSVIDKGLWSRETGSQSVSYR